jgi:hypothetical protein
VEVVVGMVQLRPVFLFFLQLADSHQTSFTASRDPGQFDEACSPQAVLVSALTIVLLLCLLLWQCWKTRFAEFVPDQPSFFVKSSDELLIYWQDSRGGT